MMELLAELTERDVGASEIALNIPSSRKAARAILSHDGKIALLYVGQREHHKLPGGGVDEGETIGEALQREIKEETGCLSEVGNPVGRIIENNSVRKEQQTSDCFFAEVTQIGEPSFTEKEKKRGFRLVWKTLDDAITTMEKENPNHIFAKFIVTRDLIFLKKAKEILHEHTHPD